MNVDSPYFLLLFLCLYSLPIPFLSLPHSPSVRHKSMKLPIDLCQLWGQEEILGLFKDSLGREALRQ